MIKDFQIISLLDILPENIIADEKVNAAARALDAELQKVTEKVIQTILISRIDELPENVIDLLAWQWHVDFYEPLGLDIETKRDLIRQSIAWHRIKGTPAVVEEMVTAVFARGRIAEWFEYGGEPYYFRIYASGFQSEVDDNLERLIRVVESVKNVRSWLESFIIDLNPYKELPENQLRVTAGTTKAKPGEGILFADTGIVEDPDAFTGKIGLFRVGRSHIGMA